MRKLTIQEFAGATGQKEGTIRQHISRKKIFKTKDGMIDVDSPLSKAYIHEVTKGAGLYGAVVKTVTVKEAKEKPVKPEKTELQLQIEDLDMRKRISETNSKEREAELKSIQLEKLAGNLLPTDIVTNTISINIQAILKNFESSLENLAQITVEKFGGTREDISDITKKLRLELVKIINKAKTDANHEIENMIKDVMESRTKGQRK